MPAVPETRTAALLTAADPEAMSTAEFLAYLSSLGVELRASQGKLRLNAPVNAVTPALQEQLRQRKPRLLTYLIESSQEEETAPLTFAQQRLWLIERFSPGTLAYNVPQSWVVQEEINPEVLRTALHALSNRHPALRTRIEMREGQPVQAVLRQAEIPLAFTDLANSSHLPHQEEVLQELLVREARRPFLLDQAPLIRFHLIRLAPGQHVVAYNMHHIVTDQWSLNRLRRDISALYLEALTGQASGLPPVSRTYTDVARREQKDASLHAGQLEYWRKRLQGMPTLLELPFSKSRPLDQAYAGATFHLSLDAHLSNQLRRMAAARNTSLYFLMLSLFATLLYRYIGQADFCLGTPVSGRKHREEEEVVGLFVNMLALRCSIDPAAGFETLLQQLGSAVLNDFEHGDLPFQKLVTELHPQRSSAYSPLFQIIFALNPKGPGSESGGQELKETYIGVSKFDLSLQVAEQSETIDAHFEYRTDLFDPADIERFAGHLVQLARSVVESPGQPVSTLPMLTPADLESIRRWNATELPFDREDTLVSLFEHSAHENPTAAALYFGETIWTYSELSHRANQLAASLHDSQVGPGDYIALCLDRSPELIVAILAVLKTGAAYLPLDPRYPVDRLAYMLEDSGARFLITDASQVSDTSQVVDRLANACPRLTVLDTHTSPTNLVQPATVNSTALHPEDAAYLIYTSGSTGKPKGVVIEHRNAVALIAWARSAFEAPSLRCLLASTSVSFDVSIFEIFAPLATGNSFVLVGDVLQLQSNPHADRVTLLNVVPSAMDAVLAAGLPPSIRTVCLAGEFAPTALVDRIYAVDVEQVMDLYGPSETTTFSTFGQRHTAAPATIGRPIANTRVYLVDENLVQVPPGAAGEILIAGDGVTRGYLNRPELTAEKYLTLPQFEPVGRLYRSGDMARHDADGSLIYLGRRDQQVKLRGHRIELGEIESALRDLTQSTQVVVVVQKLPAGDALTAFVVPGPTAHVDASTCLATLRTQLPAWMIPSTIRTLPTLPLTPSGKIDRKLLSLDIEAAPPVSSQPPIDLLEQWLANIWAARLGLPHVSRNANFFDELGGHSLVAFEIFTEIEKRLGVAMMLTTLFQAPTVQQLAAAIRRLPWKQPVHLRFVSPGSLQYDRSVLYLVGDAVQVNPSAIDHHPLHDSGQRIMAIHSGFSVSDRDQACLEITAFESTRPAITLVSSRNEEPLARQFASALKARGCPNVALRHFDA